MGRTVYEDCIGSTQPKEPIPGLPDYGWRVAIDYSSPESCKPWTSPRLKQVIQMFFFGLRYIWFWLLKKIEGKRPFIDNLRQIPHSPIYGVPIGGLGCGTIGRGYKGEFCRYQMIPGMYEHEVIVANQFIVCVRRKGETVYQQVLSPSKPQNKSHLNAWQWNYNGSHGVYQGLYPRSWTVYDIPEQNIRLICRQISPVFPHDYQDTCLPVAVFIWQVENSGEEDVDVSVTFTFKNGLGTKEDGIGGAWTEPFISEGSTASGVMIHQQFKHMPCTYGVSAAQRDGVSVSHKLSFNPKGSGHELWSDLWQNGSLKPGTPRGSENRTVKSEEVGVAVCGLRTVKAHSTGQVEMCLTWDMPIIHFGANGKRYARRYTRWFGTEGNASPDLARHCFKHYPFWEEKIEAWQSPILQNPKLPNWYKSALFNELYFITDGGTVWVDPIDDFSDVTDSETEAKPFYPHIKEYGKFAYLEGHEYRMYNTYDVHHYASFALTMLWPMLQLCIQYEFAEVIMQEDLRQVKFLFTGHTEPLKPHSVVPHDLGDPENEPWLQVNAYLIHPTYMWKDLNLKFVLQVYRDYVALGKVDYLVDMYPVVKAVMDYSLQWDTDNDGVIDNGGFPDQTYDGWMSTGASAYCGGIWLTAVRMMVEIGLLLEKHEDVIKYQEILDRGKKSFSEKLWNGRYYNYDASENSYHDSIMADMLCGPWYLKAAKLQDEQVFPSEFIHSALKVIYETNVMSFANGKMGAINGMRPNGKKDLSSVQSDEFWVGTTYALAATMIQEGMVEEGFRTASGPYHMCYEHMGLAFQTPEAYFESRCYRSLGYMRPLAIWAIQWALQTWQPQLLFGIGDKPTIRDKLDGGGEPDVLMEGTIQLSPVAEVTGSAEGDSDSTALLDNISIGLKPD
ncbi:non-lysosomal glucosylceramidase-like [Liolophura sinensis]|uniref:non-lysosomal glucosylceramidase-like n=1 Tax=Liolophura sinensis TaxID=3198878 RepID=UPI003158A426